MHFPNQKKMEFRNYFLDQKFEKAETIDFHERQSRLRLQKCYFEIIFLKNFAQDLPSRSLRSTAATANENP